MARMSVDDMLARDPRVDRLARLCGWSRRETRSCLQDVWALCYDRVVPYLGGVDIEETALRDAISPPAHPAGFLDALLEVGLARKARASDRWFTSADGTRVAWKDPNWRGRYYLAGAHERVGYLLTKKLAGAKGGRNSGESRRNQTKHSLSTAKARGNPPDLVPDSSPDLVPDGGVAPDPDDPATAVAELAANLTHPPPELEIRSDWKPRETDENRAASKSAEKRGILVEYARQKFVEHGRSKGWTLVELEPQWRKWLLTENPTPPNIRDALTRVSREQAARAEQARRDAEEAENARRASEHRDEVQRIAARAARGQYPTKNEETTA